MNKSFVASNVKIRDNGTNREVLMAFVNSHIQTSTTSIYVTYSLVEETNPKDPIDHRRLPMAFFLFVSQCGCVSELQQKVVASKEINYRVAFCSQSHLKFLKVCTKGKKKIKFPQKNGTEREKPETVSFNLLESFALCTHNNHNAHNNSGHIIQFNSF